MLRLAADPRTRVADEVAARYGMDPYDVLAEPDPLRVAVRQAAFISRSQTGGHA